MSENEEQIHVSGLELSSKIMKLLANEYPNLNINTRKFNAIIRASQDIAKELNISNKEAQPNSGLDKWLKSDEVGLSSKYLAKVLSQRNDFNAEYAVPYDPSDFQRCRKMLDAAPELKERLYLISDVSEVWKGLFEDWNKICDSIDNEEYGEAYNLINKNH
tara:strand:- start:41 stop:523 length:483 start_codon:yes stop_codon:yes gene_type:complete